MNEADMYKQRLEAIAEKLQLQEEQERARREMGEERLRLEQLKRKSLRDQWLMEGAPPSPASSVTQSPRSPLWGSEAQKEEHIDQYSCGLQLESQQLTEEEKEPMENRKTQEAAEMEEAGAESSGDGVCTDQSLLEDETTMLLPNDRGEEATSPDSSENNQSSSSWASTSGDGLRISVSEEEPAPALNLSFSEKEEETAVMVAEHVIVTDEKDEPPEVIEGQLKGMQLETDQEKQEAVGEEIKREASGEKHEKTKHTSEMLPSPAGGEEENSPVPPLGVAAVSTVPVYSQPKSVYKLEAEDSAAATHEGADSSIETKEPLTVLGQFQEVFLVEPQNNKWMEGMPGEQDSLLPQAKAPDTDTEPTPADTSASAENRNPNRASRKEKSKTGLCCTVM